MPSTRPQRTVAPGVTTRNGETFTARLSTGHSSRYLGTTDDLDAAVALVLTERARRLQDQAAVLLAEADTRRLSSRLRKVAARVCPGCGLTGGDCAEAKGRGALACCPDCGHGWLSGRKG